MKIFWESPFNKIVRSSEALWLGFMFGMVSGILLMIFMPTHISAEHYYSPSKICGRVENVKTVNYNYIGRIEKVVCKDNRVFEEFEVF